MLGPFFVSQNPTGVCESMMKTLAMFCELYFIPEIQTQSPVQAGMVSRVHVIHIITFTRKTRASEHLLEKGDCVSFDHFDPRHWLEEGSRGKGLS